MTDWFRRTTWSEQDRAEFFARLKRSRGEFHKAQYLRVQALHLEQSGNRHAALELLDLVVTDYPHPSQLALVHGQRGRCLDDGEAGLAAYRASFAAQRAYRSMTTTAYLDFAELVVAFAREDLYAEALAALDEFGRSEPFPILRYRSFAVRALVADRSGHGDQARRYAESALDAAAATESPFRYHRKVGLVSNQETDRHARLLALVGRTH